MKTRSSGLFTCEKCFGFLAVTAHSFGVGHPFRKLHTTQPSKNGKKRTSPVPWGDACLLGKAAVTEVRDDNVETVLRKAEWHTKKLCYFECLKKKSAT